jgi:hypothetical protein
MRTRSGLTYADVKQAARVARGGFNITKKLLTAGRRKLKSRRGVKRSEVQSIVRNTIRTTADKRAISNTLTASVPRTFNQKLIANDIIQGDTVVNRSGESIHINTLKFKYVITHTGQAAAGGVSTTIKGVLPGAVTWKMFFVQVTRTDVTPRDFWWKIYNEDGERDFRFPAGGVVADLTPQGDTIRENLMINTDDIKILRRKFVTVHGATGGSLDCTQAMGTFTHRFKSPIKMKFNLTAAQTTTGPTWLAADLSKRIYLIYYASQPDPEVNDGLSRATIDGVLTTHFTDN